MQPPLRVAARRAGEAALQHQPGVLGEPLLHDLLEGELCPWHHPLLQQEGEAAKGTPIGVRITLPVDPPKVLQGGGQPAGVGTAVRLQTHQGNPYF